MNSHLKHFWILKLSLVLLLSLSVHFNSKSQEIVYDPVNKSFDKIFPFDQAFRLTVKNVDAEAKEVNIILKNISNVKQVSDELKSAGKEVNEKNIFEHSLAEPVYVIHAPVTGSGSSFAATSIQLLPLSPNENYYIKVDQKVSKPLTDRQGRELRTKLKRDVVIEDFADLMIAEAIVPERANSDLDRDFIADYYWDFVPKLKQVLKDYSPSLRLVNIDSENLTEKELNIQEAAADIHDSFLDLENNTQIFNSALVEKKEGSEVVSLLDVKFDGKWTDRNWISALVESIVELGGQDDLTFKDAADKESFQRSLNFTTGEIERISDELEQTLNLLYEYIVDDIVANRTVSSISLNATYDSDFVKKANTYISMDIGYGWTSVINRHYGYTAANIYFRPVNENVPLKYYTGGDWWLRRMSLVVGLSVVNGIDEKNVRNGFVDDKGLLLGIGFKLLPWLNINAGGMFFNNVITPLSDRSKLHTNVFFSAAIDFRLKTSFSNSVNGK